MGGAGATTPRLGPLPRGARRRLAAAAGARGASAGGARRRAGNARPAARRAARARRARAGASTAALERLERLGLVRAEQAAAGRELALTERGRFLGGRRHSRPARLKSLQRPMQQVTEPELTAPPGDDPARRRRGVRRDRPAGRLADARRADRPRRLAVDGPRRARRAREPRAADASAHLRRAAIPTERGYRYYADRLLERLDPHPEGFPLDLSAARSEVDSALQATTEMLSEVTRLLALVSAPPLGAATVRHVEVLLLQPQAVMVVVITSTGSVTKRVYRFAEPVDPMLADWAAAYLNDRVGGLELGSNVLRRRLDDPGLGPRERAFLATVSALFDEARGRRAAGAVRRRDGRPARGPARRRSSTPTRACSRCWRSARRCSRSSARRSIRASRSSASGRSSTIPRCATSRSSAPPTA